MQSLDINVMICNPFDYAQFSKWRKVMKLFSLGALTCFMLGFDDLVPIIVALVRLNKRLMAFDKELLSSYQSILYKLDAFGLAKMILFKIIFTGVVAKLSWNTKKSLDESANMAGDKAKHALYRRLFVFSLLPLFLNLFFVIPEAISEGSSYDLDNIRTDCKSIGFFERMDVKLCGQALLIPLGSLSYIVAYTTMYPNIRGALLCKGSNQNGG